MVDNNLKLDCINMMYFYPKAPFDFNYTVYKPSHFPITTCIYENGIFYFTTCFQGVPVGIKLINQGTVEQPEVKAMIFSDKEVHKEFLNDLYQEIMWRFDMNMDIGRFNSMAQNDALLGPVVTRRFGMRIMTNHSLYEFLIVAFVLQNATIKRTVQMMENLIDAYGYNLEFDKRVIPCFWSPSRLSDVDENELKKLKVGYRAKFIKRLSEDFYKYELDENKLRLYKSEDLSKELLRLYGIGKQSVWYIMFEVFHRYDALETISPWEQKIYSRLIYNKELVNVEKIIKRVSRSWGKWRMLAMHYLFEDLFWRRKNGEELWLDNYLDY